MRASWEWAISADLLDVRVEKAEGVRAGHHDRRHLVGHRLLEELDIHVAVGGGRHGDDLITGNGGRGRIGAVGRIGNDDVFLLCLVPLGGMVGGNQQ